MFRTLGTSLRKQGDPQIGLLFGARQRQLANSRMMQAVPTADVVITNPTHFAVALKYDARSMTAPMVVAKGADYLAARIRQIAESRCPYCRKSSLAKALYDAVPVGRRYQLIFIRLLLKFLRMFISCKL